MKRVTIVVFVFSLIGCLFCYADTVSYDERLAVIYIQTNAVVKIGAHMSSIICTLGEPQLVKNDNSGNLVLSWPNGLLVYCDKDGRIEKITIWTNSYKTINGLTVGDSRKKAKQVLGTYDEWKDWISCDIIYGAWVMQIKMKDDLIAEIHISRDS